MLAKRLLTEVGYLDALADLYERLSSGLLTRDETSSLIGARRCLEGFAKVREQREDTVKHRELLAAHTTTQDLLRHAQGSGVTSFDRERIQVPRLSGEGDSKN